MSRFAIKQILLLCLMTCAISFCSCDKTERAPFHITALDSGTDSDLMAVHFLNMDTGFAVGGARYSKAEMLRTQDGGNSWHSLETGLTVGIFDIDFFNDSLGIAVAYGGLLVKTTDLGESWQLIDLGFPAGTYTPLRSVSILNQNTIVAVGGVGYESGVLAISTDSANTWTTTWSEELEYRSLATIENKLVLAGFSEVLQSDDQGQTWQLHNVSDDYFSDLAIVQDHIYVCGVFGTLAKGHLGEYEPWQVLRDGNKLLKTRWRMEAIAAHSDPDQVFVAGEGLFKYSPNAGADWMDVGDQSHDLLDLHLLDNSLGYAVGRNGILLRFESE